MIYFLLAYEFFKIGLFSFGGGYATIPFLFHIAEVYKWYSLEDLTQMLAVASITPGPVGINMATFAGIKTVGFLGALVATVSEMLPSLFFILIVAKLLKKFSDNFYVKTVVKILKPVGCALLVSVAIGLLKPEITSVKAMIILLLLFLLSWKNKKAPLFYILISGLLGVVLKFISQISFS